MQNATARGSQIEATPLAVDGLILAGGRSTRFGRDKALAEFEGEAMIVRVHRVLSAVAQRVMVSLSPDQEPYPGIEAEIVRDKYSEGGPIVGLQAGLLASRTPWVLVAACDMPLLDVGSVSRLLPKPGEDAHVVVASGEDGRLHPTLACYSLQFLETVETCLALGERALVSAVRRVPHRTVLLPDPVISNVNYDTGNLTTP